MKKTNEYWAEQAKLPAPDGYVCIGYGSESDHLNNYFQSIEIHTVNSGDEMMNRHWAGCRDNCLYYLEIPYWEKSTGLKFNQKTETNMKKGICTKQNGDAVIILKNMVIDRGMKWYNSGNWILHNDYSTGISQLFDGGDEDWRKHGGSELYKEVPLHEFIYELGKIPVKEKEIIINLLPWTVTIRGDKVDIGCKKNVKLADFKQMAKDLTSLFGTHDFKGSQIKIGKNGFLTEGTYISWETWEKFAVELKKLGS